MAGSVASHADARELTVAQRADLSLMQSLLPRPAGYTQQEWDEILVLEAPSVLGVASSSANCLDEESLSEGSLGSYSASNNLGDSPCSRGTSLPYSMTDSEDVEDGGINVATSGLPSPLHIDHPAELRSLAALETGQVTRQAIMELLDLLPHSGRPIQAVPGHGYVLSPRSFTTGAYARGPNAGTMRTLREFPVTSQLLASVVRSCAPDCTFSSLTLTRNLMSNMRRDSYNSRFSPNILIPLSHFLDGGLWVEDAQGDVLLEHDGPRGRVVSIQPPYTLLWPRVRHATLPWRGDRLLLIGFHISQAARLNDLDRRRLRELSFHLE